MDNITKASISNINLMVEELEEVITNVIQDVRDREIVTTLLNLKAKLHDTHAILNTKLKWNQKTDA